MASVLMHITHGPEHPTRVTLGLLVAKAAVDEGHDVTVFLAGDAVQFMRDEVLDSVQGVGTGSARDHFGALQSAGVKFYVSKLSSSARGLSESELEGKNAQMASPNMLVNMSLEHDRMFTY